MPTPPWWAVFFVSMAATVRGYLAVPETLWQITLKHLARDCQCSQKHWQCINNAMTTNCNNGAASSLIQNKQQEPTQQPQTPKQKHKAHPNQHQDNTHMQDRSTVGRGTEKVKHTSLPYSLADVLLQQTVHTGINHSAISIHQKRLPIHKSPVQINSSHHSVPFSFFY